MFFRFSPTVPFNVWVIPWSTFWLEIFIQKSWYPLIKLKYLVMLFSIFWNWLNPKLFQSNISTTKPQTNCWKFVIVSLLSQYYSWILDVVHLEVPYNITVSHLDRLKSNLLSLEVSNESLESVVSCEGLNLNKLVINCDDLNYSDVCLKGLFHIKSKSIELQASEVSFKDVMGKM